MTVKLNFGEFCWNELATAEVQAAKDFYSKVFDWTFETVDMEDMTYTMIKRDHQNIGGIWSIPKDKQAQIPSHWMSYILVKDLDASLAKALENGATLIKPATNAGNIGRLGIIVDPTGAHIAFWQALGE